MNQIAKNIKHAMVEAEITSEASLAASIGMLRATFNFKMHNGGPWKDSEKVAIASKTKRTVEEIFTEEKSLMKEVG